MNGNHSVIKTEGMEENEWMYKWWHEQWWMTMSENYGLDVNE